MNGEPLSPPSRSGRRGPGRPSVLDAESVAEAALRLWSERGYAATGWHDLSEATGISTRTLIRHFSSKAAIAWVGVGAATERLRAGLDAATDDTPLAEAIRTAVVSSVSHEPRIRHASREWLQLISHEPEIAAMASVAYRPWIDELASYIHGRLPEAPPAICQALATAYQAAAGAALSEWALSGADTEPADAVDAMLRWMDVHAPIPSGDRPAS
ncbi:AcrR family transcriptional regulator [Prescottella agglutinans]|uniref:AcrR family transcriptional regulator n=1 Tax=Prescottella agglutinans TaxID=1644129 RepID=A0ABT6M807_9NOCA|nr:AcrR family transcriptional regulator [Prescottella agglutinans]